MARAGLALTVKQMALLTGVSHDTITRLEKGEQLKPSTVQAIKGKLENVGVQFIGDAGVIYDPTCGSGPFLYKLAQVLEDSKNP
tara:strand:+ start:701 stop:952 length:252 start_codon:yes stop_codon:yes gene_type:complete